MIFPSNAFEHIKAIIKHCWRKPFLLETTYVIIGEVRAVRMMREAYDPDGTCYLVAYVHYSLTTGDLVPYVSIALIENYPTHRSRYREKLLFRDYSQTNAGILFTYKVIHALESEELYFIRLFDKDDYSLMNLPNIPHVRAIGFEQREEIVPIDNFLEMCKQGSLNTTYHCCESSNPSAEFSSPSILWTDLMRNNVSSRLFTFNQVLLRKHLRSNMSHREVFTLPCQPFPYVVVTSFVTKVNVPLMTHSEYFNWMKATRALYSNSWNDVYSQRIYVVYLISSRNFPKFRRRIISKTFGSIEYSKLVSLGCYEKLARELETMMGEAMYLRLEDQLFDTFDPSFIWRCIEFSYDRKGFNNVLVKGPSHQKSYGVRKSVVFNVLDELIF